MFRNCTFDEAPKHAVRLDGTAVTRKHDAVFDNCNFNAGVDYGAGVFSKAIYATEMRHVRVINTTIGFVNNVTEFETCEFNNVDIVEFNGHRQTYGGKYVTFSGTTGRVRVRNSSFQGSVTHPTGFNNSAGALIDADSPMPATASAAALAPKGKITHVTGTVNVTSITTTNCRAGDVIQLIFDDVLTFTDGNNLKIAGNFVTTADDSITLGFDGTNFYERGRSVN